MQPTTPAALPAARRPRRTRPRTAGGAVAALAATVVVATAVPASAAPAAPVTEALPGNAPLSALATARPAAVAEAEQQFTARTPARFRDQRLTWGDCPASAVPTPEAAVLLPLLECSQVRAPRDWNAPDDGHEITVAISRLRSEGPRPARTILTNPGGPGAAGLYVPLILAARPAVAATSEIVGVDVRGTGSSTNVTCGLDEQAVQLTLPDPRDRSPQALGRTAAVMAEVARACRTTSDLAPHVNTEQTVADLDLVRDALGRDQVDWVGYSGGTWLGAQYATYFPARVGRFVLDSAVDVASPFQQVFAEDQPPAFQRRFTADFQPWAAQHHDRFFLGRTPQEVNATYERLRASLAARPLDLGPLGRYDGATVDVLITSAMYSKARFEELAVSLGVLRLLSNVRPLLDGARAEQLRTELEPQLSRLAALLRRSPTMQPPLVAGGALAQAPDAQTATFYNTTCNDTAWSQGADFWNDLGRRQGERHPLVGWAKTQQPCGYWERPALSLPRPDGRDLPPLLIVQSEHDPATPVEGALRSHAALGSSRLVLVEDEGDHALYAGIGNPCVDGVVDRFLTTGQAPAGDVTCEGTGLPEPGFPRLSDARAELRALLLG
ncbi:alpha/beta hydrolase [Kineococcus glutinatus]|uniref:Alpha/beta hydrolase n=1 Tax=Kineococcus glutinatus TaxID=1070872 RepID=A0ABP8VEN0_9ACTN